MSDPIADDAESARVAEQIRALVSSPEHFRAYLESFKPWIVIAEARTLGRCPIARFVRKRLRMAGFHVTHVYLYKRSVPDGPQVFETFASTKRWPDRGTGDRWPSDESDERVPVWVASLTQLFDDEGDWAEPTAAGTVLGQLERVLTETRTPRHG